MANVEWLDLPDVTSALGADLLALSQSGTLSNITVANLFASPTAIGSTTPAAGTFTTLIGTTIDGVIGSVTPAAGDFTTLKTTSTLMVGSTSVSPDGTAHVFTASAGTVAANAAFDDLVVENSAAGGITILTPNNQTGGLVFGDPDNATVGRIQYNHSGNQLELWTGNAQRITVESDGKTGIGIDGPDGTLHVHTASAGTVTANSAANDLVVEASGSGGASILVPDISNARVAFGSPSDAIGAQLIWNYSALEFKLGASVSGASTVFLSGNDAEGMRLDGNKNVVVGTAAIATTATDGFLYIPTCAGTPTGTPTAKTGLAPMVYDSTGNKFWMYDGSWIGVALT